MPIARDFQFKIAQPYIQALNGFSSSISKISLGGISEARVYELFRAIGYKELVAFELARLTTFLADKNIRRNIQALYNEKI